MRTNALKKYLIFAKAGVQNMLAYRGYVIMYFLSSVLQGVLMALLWWAIYKFSDSTISGFTFPQMMLYVMLAAIFNEMFYSPSLDTISDDVKDGLIGMRLMKPINYRNQLAFTAAGTFGARLILFSLPLGTVATLIAVYGFGLDGITWYNILACIPALILAAAINDSICFLFGQLAFRTQAMFGVSMLLNQAIMFLSGMLVPLALFPAWAQTVLSFTPFPSMLSMPLQLFLGQIGGMELLKAFGISIVWVIVLECLGRLCFKASVRKVVVFGG